jgi:hypothetical protein
MPKSERRDRGWWRRRSLLNIRNGRLVFLGLASLAVGIGSTLLTAYLGIR